MSLDPSQQWPFELPRSGNDPISFALNDLEPTLFREYDVRGQVDPTPPTKERELNEFAANRLGRTFGTYLEEHGQSDVVVGHDSRSYSEKLASAFVLGLLSTGRNVHFIGLATTPLVYFSQHHLGGFAGVQVTASHNPNGWAGFKLGDAPSSTLGPEQIGRLQEIAAARSFTRGVGTYVEKVVIPDYIDELKQRIPRGDRALRIVVDGGNSISGPIMVLALRAAGYEVLPINHELDWEFPNHEPDPESVAARRQIADAVREQGADVGLSIDGDGDRLGVTDELGGTVWADIVLALLARNSLERHPGSPIVYDVKSSRTVKDVIVANGGTPVMWKTGHSHIKAKAREVGAPFSGERSGHFFDAGDYYGFDDAVYAGLRFAQILSSGSDTVSGIVGQLPQYVSTPTMHAHCPDQKKYAAVEEIHKLVAEDPTKPKIIDVNGVRAEWDDGWFLVRASSNLPAVVIVVEATSDNRLKELYETVRGLVAKCPDIDAAWENDPFAGSSNSD